MALNPQDRYKSVLNLRQEVHKYLMGYSTLAENAGFIKEFKLFYRRNRTSSNIFFSLFVVIMVMISGFLIGLERSRQSEREAKQVAQNSREKLEYTLQLFAEEKKPTARFLTTIPEMSLSVFFCLTVLNSFVPRLKPSINSW